MAANTAHQGFNLSAPHVSYPCVDIILVNYRNLAATQVCLAHIAALNYPSAQLTVWVVDNGGHDWAVLHTLTQVGNITVKPLCSEQNGGFGAGNNVALRHIMAAYSSDDTSNDHPTEKLIWLLNNDTQPTPDSLQQLLSKWRACCQQGQSLVMVGGLITHPDGQFQQVATHVNRWTGSSKGYQLAQAMARPHVDSLSGACMLIPHSVIQRIGLMPEDYFLYFEDVAYCLQAQQAGVVCVIAPLALIAHAMGSTTNAIPQTRSYYYLRNRWHVIWQYATWPQRVTLSVYGVIRWVRSIIKAFLCTSAGQHERQVAHQVFMLALTDALKGVTGPCPHPQLR
jgi:N-acetylglucosaminyl-diphospho-decaprenol L-rhamnosyltransferase